MSRSNPNANLTNPAKRWFEWHGQLGAIRYYDKEAKANVDVALPFTFLLLDQLGTVKGWHDSSESGIYANEVRDSRQETLVVKAFKVPGVMAEGRYRDIKDRVHTLGGHYVANCYIAFKNGNGELSIGSLQFKGAALHAWAEFSKSHRDDVQNSAITIDGYTEGKKGSIRFRVPTFKVQTVSKATNDVAVALDVELQTYLTAYFKRTTNDRIAEPPDEGPSDYDENQEDTGHGYGTHPDDAAPLTDDDIPF